MTCRLCRPWSHTNIQFILGNFYVLWNFFLCVLGHLILLIPYNNNNTQWFATRCAGEPIITAMNQWLYISSLTTIITTLIAAALYGSTHWPPLEKERDAEALTLIQRLSYRVPFFVAFVFYVFRSLLLTYRGLPLLMACIPPSLLLSNVMASGGLCIVFLQCLTYAMSPMLLLLYSVIEINKCASLA